jgi:hypothetical protein
MDDVIIASEIAERLGLKFQTVKARLRKAGIKPIRMIGTTGVYALDALEAIRTVRPAHRPTKAGEKSSNKED